MPPVKTLLEKAVFACGCFWHVQDAFDMIQGVASTRVGYAGGRAKNPTYEQVCSGATGHAESVEVKFDPSKVSYGELVAAFFAMHDPTQFHRQGPDVGSQYRSVVFYRGAAQKKAAEKAKAELEKSRRFDKPVVTEIVPAATFWEAEEYHQKYYQKHPFRKVCGI